MSKFNKEMYDKIKGKKNEPLSSISQKTLKIVDREKMKVATKRGSSTPTPTPTLNEGRSASSALSMEELAPPLKKRKTEGKGKEKVGSSIWANAGVAMARANNFLTPEEMREISSIPSHEMVSEHVHKLVQVFTFCFYSYCFVIKCMVVSGFEDTFYYQVLGEMMHITSQYLVNKEKAVVATSKVEALEAKASRLRKDLIESMDAHNTSKEQVKALTKQMEVERLLVKQKDELLTSSAQRMKAIMAKAVLAFQSTDEYNTFLF